MDLKQAPFPTSQKPQIHSSGIENFPSWKKPGKFPGLSKDTANEIREEYMRVRLSDAMERKNKGLSAFSKSVNPHNFRHSRATELGGIGTMNEGLLCRFFGWQLGSKMPSVYMHLRHDQVRNALLASYGKAKVESTQIISAKKCPRCKTENSLAAKYCQICGNDFDLNKMPSTVEELREQLEGMKAQITKLQMGAARGTVLKAKMRFQE